MGHKLCIRNYILQPMDTFASIEGKEYLIPHVNERHKIKSTVGVCAGLALPLSHHIHQDEEGLQMAMCTFKQNCHFTFTHCASNSILTHWNLQTSVNHISSLKKKKFIWEISG